MNKRKKSPFSLSEIGANIPGKQRSNGKPLSKARVSAMLNNPDAGQNRQRLTAALKLMGLNDEAITKFIDGSNSTQ